MWKAEENYRETKQGEVEDKDSMGTVLLSAGTALLMAACLKRAVVLFLVEQWRVWVFLVLNLIVVAIFFTSSPSNYRESQDPSVGKKQKKIKDRECKVAEEKVEKVEAKPQEMDKEEEIEEEEIEEEEEEEEEEDADVGLSKEELNERVEAFIVMFKQQLILDARKGGNSHTPLSYNSR
ncbi:coiled-coil domain-containing glutamate-rich protein 1 [Momordica charantia]|uniref:Coiled-coil domain-containing glutamate-rich protein 1 n=1 Tax=Momordica charantia TaxID=3673 RepID=A0A6J1C149_MOMCH|nr:coiled-coil domain-containing glutamate-rich protein 1 [Momordica charantia]